MLSPAYAIYKKVWPWICKPLTLLYHLSNTKETSKARIGRKTDVGSPWRVDLLLRLKYFVVKPPFIMQDSRFFIKIWLHFRIHSPKPDFSKLANEKE